MISNNAGLNDGHGAGVWNATGATAAVARTVISGNTAAEGGGIFNQGTLDIVSSTITRNDDSGITNEGTLIATNVTISGNTAWTGAGIRHGHYSHTTLNDITIAFNVAQNSFGGMTPADPPSPSGTRSSPGTRL